MLAKDTINQEHKPPTITQTITTIELPKERRLEPRTTLTKQALTRPHVFRLKKVTKHEKNNLKASNIFLKTEVRNMVDLKESAKSRGQCKSEGDRRYKL